MKKDEAKKFCQSLLQEANELKYFSYKKPNSISNTIIKYMTGTQDVNVLLQTSNLEDSTQLKSLNLRPIRLIPRFVYKIKQRMKEIITNPSVRAYDPLTLDYKRELASQIMYEYMLMPMVMSLNQEIPDMAYNSMMQALNDEELQNQLGGDVPSTIDMYNYIMQQQTDVEKAIESIINKIMLQNDYKQVVDNLCYNIIGFNLGFLHIYTHNGVPNIKSLNTYNVIYPKNAKNNNDLLNMNYGGYITQMNGAYIHSNFNLDKEIKEKIEDDVQKTYDVLYFFKKIPEKKIYYQKKGKKYKNLYITENMPQKTQNYEVEPIVTYYNQIIEGYYVLDINEIIELRKQPMTVYYDLQNCFSPIVGISPNIMEGNTSSIVEDMIPHSDQAHIAILKIRQLIGKARPKGIAIDMYALAETIASSKNPLDTQTIIENYNKEGNIVYTSVNEENERINVTIQELINGIDRNTLLSLVDTYKFNVEMLRYISGINEVADIGNVHPESLVGVQEMALKASISSTKEFVESLQTILDYTYTYLINLVAAMSKFSPETLYKYYSDDIQEALSIISRISMSDMHIDIRPVPSYEEISALQTAIQIALQQQNITESQYVEITSAFSFTQKQELLKKYIEENRNNKLKEQQQIEQTKTQLKLQEMQAELEMKLQLMEAEKMKFIEEQDKKTADTIAIKEKEHMHRMEQIELLVAAQMQQNDSENNPPSESLANKTRRNMLSNMYRVRRWN